MADHSAAAARPLADGEPGTGRSRARLERRPTARETLVCFGHLAVLSAFALAQPLFNLLSENPEFFAARGSTGGEIIVFALLLVLLPPAILLAIEVLSGLAAGGQARRGVHLVLMALLAAVVFVQALKRAIGASDLMLVVLAAALGVAAAVAYARTAPVRSFVSVLTPAPLVFLILFLFISPVSKITLAGEASAQSIGGIARVPVVMVVFDELPSTSLMDERRRVDPKRFPAFAELAGDSTWFRGAHGIYDSTSRAVPAIMDGNFPKKETLATSGEHPNSIFALLGKSHRMNVSEEATSVCPRDLCRDTRSEEPLVERLGSLTSDLSLVYAHVVSPPAIERDLPTVSQTWGNFGGEAGGGEGVTGNSGDQPNTRSNLNRNRRKRLESWIAAIGPGRRPALNFKHTLLPHVPWQYLPDGTLYRRQADDPISNLSRQSFPDEGQVEQLQLRHLLQLGFADYELGKLIAQLKRTRTYDESLIVVTADHGVSFKQGQFDRRNAKRSNIDEISPVPLFVKKPNQSQGRIDDSIVESTDVLPTIADLLEVKLPERTDGSSAFSPEVRARREVRMLKRDLTGWIRLSGEQFEREKRAELDKKIRLFGTGADGPDRIYRIGPNRQLVGKRASALDSGEPSDGRASLVDAEGLGDVDRSSGLVPTWIVGRVSGGGGPRRGIAIAVNGEVRAVGSTFTLATGGGETLAVMIPESSVRDGRNTVEVFEVAGGSRLRRMGGIR